MQAPLPVLCFPVAVAVSALFEFCSKFDGVVAELVDFVGELCRFDDETVEVS